MKTSTVPQLKTSPAHISSNDPEINRVSAADFHLNVRETQTPVIVGDHIAPNDRQRTTPTSLQSNNHSRRKSNRAANRQLYNRVNKSCTRRTGARKPPARISRLEGRRPGDFNVEIGSNVRVVEQTPNRDQDLIHGEFSGIATSEVLAGVDDSVHIGHNTSFLQTTFNGKIINIIICIR